MSSQKVLRKPMKALNPELAERIRRLRRELGMLQAEFAERLKVTPSQVARWEKGVEEKPSTEKILEMARIAPLRPDRLWFWKRAGVDLDSLAVDLMKDVVQEIPDPSKNLSVPVLKDLAYDHQGRLIHITDGSVSISARLYPRPERITCFKFRRVAPWGNNTDELVLVDRTVRELPNVWNKPVVVFFETFPISYHILAAQVAFPLGWSNKPPAEFLELDKSRGFQNYVRAMWPDRVFADELEKRHAMHLEDATSPGFLIGWLDLIQNEDIFEASIGEPATGQWCLGLQVHSAFSWFSPRVAISHWKRGRVPDRDQMKSSDHPLIRGVEILGQAVGWLSDQSSL